MSGQVSSSTGPWPDTWPGASVGELLSWAQHWSLVTLLSLTVTVSLCVCGRGGVIFTSEPVATFHLSTSVPHLVAMSTEDWLKKKDRFQRRPGCRRSLAVGELQSWAPLSSSGEDCLWSLTATCFIRSLLYDGSVGTVTHTVGHASLKQ